MTTAKLVEEINILLKQLPDDLFVSIIDEDGNETNLRLDGLEYDEENKEISGWCHSFI